MKKIITVFAGIIIFLLWSEKSNACAPVADFSGSPTTVCPGQTVQFTDQSTNGPMTSWLWTFPGGTPGTSGAQNPAVVYNTPGVFDVSLTVTNSFNGGSSGSTTKTGYITVAYVQPVAAFSASSTNNFCLGDTVTFTDLTTGCPTTWSWSFTGGTPSTSTLKNPKVIYNSPGVFNVTLIVSNPVGSDTLVQTNYITISGLQSDFSASGTTLYAGNSTNFTDLSSGNPTSWSWSFSGGTPSTSSNQNPATILYNTVGTYDASLTISNGSFSCSETKQDYITVLPPFSSSQFQISYKATSGPAFSTIKKVIQTSDGGYIAGGTNHLMKIDSMGNVQWGKAYSNNYGYITVNDVRPVSGGYVFTGFSLTSISGAINDNNTPNTKIILVKTDANGIPVWGMEYEIQNYKDEANAMEITSDGGYILTGGTSNNSYYSGYKVPFILKVDSVGAVQWIGKTGSYTGVSGWAAKQNFDGGYIVAGNYKNLMGNTFLFLLKLDASGNLAWRNRYDFNGNNTYDGFTDVIQTSDGGFAFLHTTISGPGEGRLVKTNSTGAVQWVKYYNGYCCLGLKSLQQTPDGGFILGGGGLNSPATGIILIKTDGSGDPQWRKALGGGGGTSYTGYSVRLAADGGYILGGAVNSNAVIIKSDANGNSNIAGCPQQNISFTASSPAYSSTSITDYSLISCTSNPLCVIAGYGIEINNKCGINKPPISLSTNVNSNCSGCSGSATVSASGGFAPYTYNWSNGSTSSTATGLCAGKYAVTVNDSEGMTEIATVQINPPVSGTTFHKTFYNYGQKFGTSVKQTPDGGYILSGAGLLKIDSIGNIQWVKGGSLGLGYSVINTTSGGYAYATKGNDNWMTPSDIAQVVTDGTGNTISNFSKIFAWNSGVNWNNDEGKAIIQTSDSGFLLAGYNLITTGPDVDFTFVKTSNTGTMQWVKNFSTGTWSAYNPDLGGYYYGDYCYDVKQTNDGGYVAVGENLSANVLLIKTASNGNLSWSKEYGGGGTDVGRYIEQTVDGGFIITGCTKSYGVGGTTGGSGFDIYLIKTNNAGNLIWTRTFGGDGDDFAYEVHQTSDSGYIMVGYTNSFGEGGNDVYLVKTDANGNLLWSKTYGGSNDDYAYSGQQTTDAGYIICGTTKSFGSGDDTYLIKTDANGNIACPNCFENNAPTQINSGGFEYNPSVQTGGLSLTEFSNTTGGTNYPTESAYCGNFSLSYSVSLSVNSCSDSCNATAIANPSGGTSPYTFLWDNGTAENTATGLCAGSYSVTVTDALSNTTSATVSISQSPPFSLTISSSDNALCNWQCYGTGTATVIVSGGTFPYNYLWNNSQITSTVTGISAGTYAVTVTDANGCTQTATTTVSNSNGPTASTSVTTNISCDSGSDGTATATASGGNSPYTYLWSNGQTNDTIAGLSAGTYTVTVTDASGCTDEETITIAQPPILSNSVIASICTGDSIYLQGAWQSSDGTYYDTLSSSEGCDSIIATTLAVDSIIFYSQSFSICSDDSIQLPDGNWVNSAGLYSDTLTSVIGCDSIVQTNLSVNTSYNIPLIASICSGDSIFLQGNYQLTAGTYYDTLASVNGCDSILATTLSVNNNVTIPLTANICAGDSIFLGGNWQTTSGTYYDTLSASNGCDSILATTLSVPAAITLTMNSTDASCGNADGSASVTASGGVTPYTYQWDGTVPPYGGTSGGWNSADSLTAGTYTVTVTDNSSCEQTATVNISNAGPPDATISSVINISCNGGNDGSATVSATGGTLPYSYLWSPTGGTDSTATGLSAGTYTVTITDSAGCLEIVGTTISEPALIQNSTAANICMGDSIFLQGSWQTTGGIYYDTLSASGGCDSILTTTLSVNNNINIPITAAICDGDSMFLQGSYQTTTGTYYDTLTAVNGCDSILATTLLVDSSIFNSVTTSLCPGDSIQLPSGNWVNSTGVYYDTLTASAGCDSIIQTNISLNAIYNIPLTASICTGDSIFLQGNYQSTAGTYTDTLTSINGCDSILSTTLSIDSAIFNTAAAFICPGDSIQLPGGNWANSAGAYYDTLTASAGCDSTIQTTLTVYTSYNIPLNAAICIGDSIYLQGNYQTTAGTYYDTLTSVSGCDSILATALSVDSAIFYSIATSLCPGDSIQLPSGNWTNTAGVYSDTLTASAGCDSIIQTTLSVNSSYNIPLTASICSGDSIFLQGSYQTAAGTYYDTLTSVNGCDSILATTLSVDSAIFNSVATSICPGDSVQLPGGSWVNAVGIYYDTLTASAECDSIIQTNISLNSAYNIPLTATICMGDSIFLQENYQSTAGTYYDTLFTVNGCDSILATTLTFTPTATATATAAICNGDSLFLQNAWQTNAGIYYDTITSSIGCDSVVATTIAVNPTATATATATLCQGDSILISGEWVNVAGTYYDSLLTASGCDSIIAINLSIDSIPVVTVGKDTTITAGISIQIVATGGSSYLWSNGETNPGITVSPEESTTYYVTVSDANGCAVTDSVKITVDISKCTVFVPTIFTPNGDGKNDMLYVRGYGLKEIEFMIYDRWGEKVFETTDKGIGWDGSFQKKELNTAVFVYMLKAVCFNNELIEEKGNITLVK